MENRQAPIYRKGTNAYHFNIMNRNKINRGHTRKPSVCKRCKKPILKNEVRHKGGRSPYHESCYKETQIGED